MSQDVAGLSLEQFEGFPHTFPIVTGRTALFSEQGAHSCLDMEVRDLGVVFSMYGRDEVAVEDRIRM